MWHSKKSLNITHWSIGHTFHPIMSKIVNPWLSSTSHLIRPSIGFSTDCWRIHWWNRYSSFRVVPFTFKLAKWVRKCLKHKWWKRLNLHRNSEGHLRLLSLQLLERALPVLQVLTKMIIINLKNQIVVWFSTPYRLVRLKLCGLFSLEKINLICGLVLQRRLITAWTRWQGTSRIRDRCRAVLLFRMNQTSLLKRFGLRMGSQRGLLNVVIPRLLSSRNWAERFYHTRWRWYRRRNWSDWI